MPTIGFFGDSFCAKKDVSIFNEYPDDTYIKLLETHYNTKINKLDKN